MSYAGFWPRTLAMIVDGIIVVVVGMVATFFAGFVSWVAAITMDLILYGLFSLYWILLTGIYGQTIGKWVAGIKVIPLDGSRITISHGLLRYSVDLFTSLLITSSTVIALLAVDPIQFNTSGFWEQQQLIVNNTPTWNSVVENISTVWVLSELVVLMFNKKRRAIHDFIAGTVVVHSRVSR